MIDWFRRLFGLRPRVIPYMPPPPIMAGSRNGPVPLGPSYTILPAPRHTDPFAHTSLPGQQYGNSIGAPSRAGTHYGG